jgi:hypothetical protein
MRKQLLVAMMAGALAGCGGGNRTSTSTGAGGGQPGSGTGGVGAPVDLSAPADSGTQIVSDGGVAVPPDGGTTAPPPAGDGGTTSTPDGGTAAPPCPATPVTLGTSGSPGPVATDSHYVYWMDRVHPQTIWRAARTGGTAEAVAVDTYSTIDGPFYLAANDDGVYWGSTAYPGGHSAGLSRVYALRPSGAVDILAEGAFVEGLVLVDSTVLFLDRYGVYAVPTAGGTQQTVYSAFDNSDGGSLTADPWHAFVQENGSITRVDRTTGVANVLGSFSGVALTVDYNRVYSLKGGVVYTVPPATGQRLSPPNSAGGGGSFIVLDGTNLYYGGPGSDLSRLASDGSGYTELAPAATSAVVSGNTVFYSHGSDVSAVCK